MKNTILKNLICLGLVAFSVRVQANPAFLGAAKQIAPIVAAFGGLAVGSGLYYKYVLSDPALAALLDKELGEFANSRLGSNYEVVERSLKSRILGLPYKKIALVGGVAVLVGGLGYYLWKNYCSSENSEQSTETTETTSGKN